MNVVVELMEAYRKYINLPLFLVSSKCTIEFTTDKMKINLFKDGIYLEELKKVAAHITIPTVVSVAEEFDQSGCFFIVSPQFEIYHDPYFLAIGPFTIKANSFKKIAVQIELVTDTAILYENEVAESIAKVSKMYELLALKSSYESSVSVPKEIVTIIGTLSNLDETILDYNRYISEMIEELIKLPAFDFLGLALKNEEDIFVIQHISGQQVQHLIEKKFYIGEGLLGKAIILGEDFHWHKSNDNQRIEFFNRYHVFPEELVGYTIKEKNQVTGILFGGSFKVASISQELESAVQCIVRILSQRKTIESKLIESYYTKTIFSNWLDLMDVIDSSKDWKHISYKILDFCQTLNGGEFSCFSNENVGLITRGTYKQPIVNLHRQYRPERDGIEFVGQCLHFKIGFNNEIKGLFTIQFDETADMHRAAYILKTIENLLKSSLLYKENSREEKTDNVFIMLQNSIMELSESKYQSSLVAINVAKKLMNLLQISAVKTEQLLNICRIMPLSIQYVEKFLNHYDEWKIILEVKNILENRLAEEDGSLEAKVLAFIYSVVIKKVDVQSIDFLNADLKELCSNTFEATVELMNKELPAINTTMNHEKIEELMDLKGVIETLNITAREKEILHLIIEGLNNHEVGQYLNISIHTVKNHVTSIFKKLNVSDRIQAMAKIYRIKYGEN